MPQHSLGWLMLADAHLKGSDQPAGGLGIQQKTLSEKEGGSYERESRKIFSCLLLGSADTWLGRGNRGEIVPPHTEILAAMHDGTRRQQSESTLSPSIASFVPFPP